MDDGSNRTEQMKASRWYGFSEIGERSNNEDHILLPQADDSSSAQVFIVCDGVGGAQKGEVASELVATGIAAFFKEVDTVSEETIRSGIASSESALREYIAAHPYSEGMATTLCMAIILDTTVYLVHVGDSKIIYIREGHAIYVSHDHSLVNEMVESGIISESEALTHPKRNVITQAIVGLGASPEPHIEQIEEARTGDAIFLCTDGVLECWSVDELKALIEEEEEEDSCIRAISERCLLQSKDNYSGCLIRI